VAFGLQDVYDKLAQVAVVIDYQHIFAVLTHVFIIHRMIAGMIG